MLVVCVLYISWSVAHDGVTHIAHYVSVQSAIDGVSAEFTCVSLAFHGPACISQAFHGLACVSLAFHGLACISLD